MGFGSGLIADREINVAREGSKKTSVTLAHSWSAGGRVATEARECLHVWHTGYRDDIDPAKIAAITPANPFLEPLSAECWLSREEAFERGWQAYADKIKRYPAKARATLLAVIANPTVAITADERLDWRLEPAFVFSAVGHNTEADARELLAIYRERFIEYAEKILAESLPEENSDAR